MTCLFVWVTHRLKRNRESGLRDLFNAKVLNYRYKTSSLRQVKNERRGEEVVPICVLVLASPA